MLLVYTDGSAIGNPGPGGWGALTISGKRISELSGAYASTTCSEMELVAAVQALRHVPCGERISLRSDSRYLIDGMRYLAYRWRNDGWKNRRGVDLQNRDLWIELIDLNERHDIRWTWIRGHSGHPLQSRADALAYEQARGLWRMERLAA